MQLDFVSASNSFNAAWPDLSQTILIISVNNAFDILNVLLLLTSELATKSLNSCNASVKP